MIGEIIFAASCIGTGWWLFRRAWQNGYRQGYKDGAVKMREHIFDYYRIVGDGEDQTED